MPSGSRTYRKPVLSAILWFLGGIVSAFFAYWSISDNNPLYVAVVFGFYTVWCLYEAGTSIYSVTLNDAEIIERGLFRRQSLAWGDVHDLVPRSGDSIALVSQDRHAGVFVSSRLNGFLEVLRSIREKRPDLWNDSDCHTFHQSHAVLPLLGLLGVGSILFGVWILASGLKVIVALEPLYIGASSLLFAAQTPRRLELEGSCMIVSFLAGRMEICIDPIARLSLEQQGSGVDVSVKLDSGRKVTLRGFKEGMPALWIALQK